MADVRVANFLAALERGFPEATDIRIAVAFITKPGLEQKDLRGLLGKALQRHASVQILVDLSAGATDPSALWDLLAIQERYSGLRLKTLLPEGESTLHTKFYLFKYREHATLVTGSANWSAAGLAQNIEHGLEAVGPLSDPLLSEADSFFTTLWESARSKALDAASVRLYEAYAGRLRATESRLRRRAVGSWRRLEAHLAAATVPFVWPGPESAYLFGIITARGKFLDAESKVVVELRYGVNLYKNGEVRVGNVGFPVSRVIPTIPSFIVDRIRTIIPSVQVTVTPQPPALSARYRITIDCSSDQKLYRQLRHPFQFWSSCDNFRLPTGLASADDSVVVEFIKGFSVACALLTDGTSLPSRGLTGLPGTKVVWLRPSTGNTELFKSLEDLIETRLGIPVYHQVRQYREPHLKIRCEDFLQIGFDIDWWDELVQEGAKHNEVRFG